MTYKQVDHYVTLWRREMQCEGKYNPEFIDGVCERYAKKLLKPFPVLDQAFLRFEAIREYIGEEK